MSSESQQPFQAWRQKVLDHIKWRGLSLVDAAGEIGVSKGAIEHLPKAERGPQLETRLKIDAWMVREEREMARRAGVVPSTPLDYWRGVNYAALQMNRAVGKLLEEAGEAGARLALETDDATAEANATAFATRLGAGLVLTPPTAVESRRPDASRVTTRPGRRPSSAPTTGGTDHPES